MNTVLNLVYSELSKSKLLKGVSITLCEDITSVVEKGKFPFINIDGDAKSYDDIDGWSPNDAQRVTYRLIIQCATKHAEKKVSVIGKTDFKGIFELSDVVYNIIVDYCQSIENTSTELKVGKKPTILQRTWIMQDRLYMAGAEFSIDLYEDVLE